MVPEGEEYQVDFSRKEAKIGLDLATTQREVGIDCVVVES